MSNQEFESWKIKENFPDTEVLYLPDGKLAEVQKECAWKNLKLEIPCRSVKCLGKGIIEENDSLSSVNISLRIYSNMGKLKTSVYVSCFHRPELFTRRKTLSPVSDTLEEGMKVADHFASKLITQFKEGVYSFEDLESFNSTEWISTYRSACQYLTKTNHQNIMIFRLAPWLDTYVCRDLLEISRSYIRHGYTRLIYDFRDVDYLGSNAVGSLMEIHITLRSIQKSEMALCNVPDIVNQAFAIFGFSEYFSKFQSLDDALAALK